MKIFRRRVIEGTVAIACHAATLARSCIEGGYDKLTTVAAIIVVEQHVQRCQWRVFRGAVFIGIGHRIVVDRRHGNRYGSDRRGNRIADRIVETVFTVEIGGRRIVESTVADTGNAATLAGNGIEGGNAQYAAVATIAIVGKYVQRQQQGIFRGAVGVRVRHRVVVDRRYLDRHGANRAALAVADRVVEAVETVEILRWRVNESSILVVEDATAIRRGLIVKRNPGFFRAVTAIGIVGKHVERRHRGVLGGTVGIGVGHRIVVNRCYLDRHGADRSSQPVADAIVETVVAVEIQRRSVVESAVTVTANAAALRRNTVEARYAERGRAVAPVIVVGEYVQRRQQCIFGRCVFIGAGDGRVVDRGHRDRYRGDGSIRAVADGIGETVRTVEVLRWRVIEGAVLVIDHVTTID